MDATGPANPEAIDDLVASLLEVVDADSVARCFPSHRAPGETARMIEAFMIRMAQVSADAVTWTEACDEFEGLNAVPLQTVHKSKGLEYHTVFFVGIDDKQWWSHKREPEASTSTFFVGLSRAAQRTIFTYCSARAAAATSPTSISCSPTPGCPSTNSDQCGNDSDVNNTGGVRSRVHPT